MPHTIPHIPFNSECYLSPTGITYVDPLAKTITFKPISNLTLPAFAAWVSPSREWVLLDNWPEQMPTPLKFHLLNVKSGVVQEINLNVFQEIQQVAPIQTIAWSPDSRYFVAPVNTVSDNFDDTTVAQSVLLYSVADGKLTKLNVRQSVQLRFAWSPDGSKIAIEGETNAQHGSRLTLDVVDVKTNQVTQSLDFGGAGGLTIFQMCNIQWSPDGRYIAFVETCTAASLTPDVQVWNIQANVLTPATTLATTYKTRNLTGGLGSLYSLNWIGNSQLMIGIVVFYSVATPTPMLQQIAQTVLYNAANETTAVVLPQQVKEIAINPVTGHFTAAVVSRYDIVKTGKPVSEPMKTGNINAASSAAGTLASIDSVSSLPDGSNLSWSPDGKMLAYQQTGTDNFIFVTDGSPPAVTYTFSDSSVAADPASKTAYILPIGWVTGNSAIAGTPAVPTPTTQPSATATSNGASVPGSNQIGGG